MPVKTKSTEYLNAIVGGESCSIELNQVDNNPVASMKINGLFEATFNSKEQSYSFLKERYDTVEIIATKIETTTQHKIPTKIK